MILTNLGWLVVHAAWQGTLVTGIAAFVVGLLRRRSARARYAVLCVALAVCAVAPLVTVATQDIRTGLRYRAAMMQSLDPVVDVPALVATGLTVLPWLGGIWITAAAAGLLRSAADWRRTARLRATTRRATLDVVSRVDVRESSIVTVPMTLGWRRPVVIVPAHRASLSSAEWQAVIAHELAHVRRRDYAVNLAQTLVERLLFFHPAALWLSRRIRTEREYCCDDAVIAAGCPPRTYLNALAALESTRDDALAVAATSGSLLDRVQRLAGIPRRVITARRGALAMLVATVVAGAILALSLVVPPGLPAGTKMRRRGPAPAAGPAPGATLAARPPH